AGLLAIARGHDDLLADFEPRVRGAQEAPHLGRLPAGERAAARADHNRAGTGHDPAAFLSFTPEPWEGSGPPATGSARRSPASPTGSAGARAGASSGTAAIGDRENRRWPACTIDMTSSGSASRSAVIGRCSSFFMMLSAMSRRDFRSLSSTPPDTRA